MNTLKGPLRIVSREMSLTFYINTGITIALLLLYMFLSTKLDGSNEMIGLIFGPFYIVFLTFAFIFFKSYKFILALGGTRQQFMLSSYIAGLFYILASALVLTAMHYLGKAIFENGYVFHMADILPNANPAMYFWVDFLWLFILFGIGMFAQVINFNLGAIRSLIIAGIIILGSITAYFFIDLAPLFEFFINDYLLFLHLLALGSLILMTLSFFMMKNAPLERGDRKIFKVRAVN